MSPVLFSMGFRGVGEETAMIFFALLIPLFYFPPLILLVGFAGIWLLCVGSVKFLQAVEDTVESTRLLIRQHKVQQDFQFRLVYECTPLDGSSAEALLHRILESHPEEES